MSGRWATSDRRDRLPADWPVRRAKVLRAAGYRCQEHLKDGSRCPAIATDVDHIDRRAGDDYPNLRALCGPHHDEKSSREGNEEKARRAAAVLRPKPMHPGKLR